MDTLDIKEIQTFNITAIIIGVIVLAAAAVLLVMAFTNSMNASTHKLENFVGLSYDELLTSNIYDYQFSAEYEQTSDMQPGVVMDQSPAEGTKVQNGSKVVLTVSASEDDISVPNIYSYSESQAKQALERAKLVNYKFLSVASETVEEGKIDENMIDMAVLRVLAMKLKYGIITMP